MSGFAVNYILRETGNASHSRQQSVTYVYPPPSLPPGLPTAPTRRGARNLIERTETGRGKTMLKWWFVLLRFTNNWFRHSLLPYQHRTCCSGMTFIITLEPYRRFVQSDPLLGSSLKRDFTFAVCLASDGTLHCPKPRISNFYYQCSLSPTRPAVRFFFFFFCLKAVLLFTIIN